MQRANRNRRSFLRDLTLATAAAGLLPHRRAAAAEASVEAPAALHLASNQYSWAVFYQRDGRDFGASFDAGLEEVSASGLNGFEPGVGGAAQIRTLVPLLKKHALEMRSIYVNSTLHTAETAERSIADIVAIARDVEAAGTRIVVTNPNPLRWGGGEDKTDAQLRTQAGALNRLGKELAAMGLTLAYHNHDIELRQAAREFHHMMVGTEPAYVGLCLDAHWIYRGAGNSQVALFDVVRLYGSRIKELHLRQSEKGVWSEVFGPGDIDYEALASEILAHDVCPHLVLEVAVETGTPKTLSPVEAHRRSVAYARKIFAGFAG